VLPKIKSQFKAASCEGDTQILFAIDEFFQIVSPSIASIGADDIAFAVFR
jgi:hypothetical protein